MLALTVIFVSFYLLHYVCRTLSAAFDVSYWWFFFGYYVVSEYVEFHHLTRMNSWRSSRIIQFIGRTLMRTRFTAESHQRLLALGSQQCIFMCEPHGVACLMLVFGFAAHGDALPASIADKTLVVAHWCFRLIPFVRNLYGIFGVIDNSSSSITRALDTGHSLALVPSALVGKWYSLLTNQRDQTIIDGKESVFIYQRWSIGCFVYAARRTIPIVPVLSPNENFAFRLFFTEYGFAPLVLPIGWWFIRPYFDIEWYVGAPQIDTGYHTLARKYYAELKELAKPDYAVKIFQSDSY